MEIQKNWYLDFSKDEDCITYVKFIFLMREVMEKIEEGVLKNNPMNGVYINIDNFLDIEYISEFIKRSRKLGVKYTISNIPNENH
ncbi:hypothetical protein [Aggregatibacter actinomycetemcomitans]|uniref:hypothetical protein n=1 Tax=Aggregatibacter actinomycetemcomitans TaxID=714 RepID=UPI00197BF610|nr:hypothetical protein [Aggregatibacter actinomycetemcomitans]MBN6058667.1 hypothetical protein [Aggregatibacter actinomycetemcomitans]MBN6087176.1 hypothetical protein [Aggregatibacter actinomycetemcomitans]